MKEIYKIGEFDEKGQMTLHPKEYIGYTEALEALFDFPIGTYQIQKLFVRV